MRLSKRIKRWTVYAGARLLAALWLALPLSWALALGRLVGAVAHLVALKDRRRAERQMVEALGISEAEAHRNVRALFAHLGMMVAEIVWLPRLGQRLTHYVRIRGGDLAVLRAALDEGRGVILISAHLGNWELLAQRVVREGIDSVTIARANPNPYLGAWLARRRQAGGLGVIDRGDPSAARNILATLKRGAILGFLMDQDTRVQSTFVPFLGRPASTPVAPAQLALRRDVPVIAAFIERVDSGHEIRLARVSLEGIEGRTRDDRINAATARMTEVIEGAVRKTPEQWVWFHERWKRQPADLDSPADPGGGEGV